MHAPFPHHRFAINPRDEAASDFASAGLLQHENLLAILGPIPYPALRGTAVGIDFGDTLNACPTTTFSPLMEQSSGQFFDLFATRIWRIYLENLSPHFGAWIANVEAMRAATPEPVGGSNRLGWNSSERAVLHHPDFAPLLQVVRTACTSAFVQMGLSNPPFELESWININDRGGFNFQHTHNGMISGCFYLRVPPGAGNIVFRDPRPAVEYSYLKGGGVNAFQDFPLIPEDGMLILFPSWLQHRVEPHENDTPRISISFNAIWR